jgi:chromosome segregation ATPase
LSAVVPLRRAVSSSPVAAPAPPRPESGQGEVFRLVEHRSRRITSDPTSWVTGVVQQVRDALRVAEMRERTAFDRTLQAQQDFEATRHLLLSRTEAAEQNAKQAEARCAAVKNSYKFYEYYLRNLRRRLETQRKDLWM